MILDLCYGGCGGIWFDVTARAATTRHSIWQVPVSNVKLAELQLRPRCLEIGQGPSRNGDWLDAGEFTRGYEEEQRAKVTSPLRATAMAKAASLVDQKTKKSWRLNENAPVHPGQ